MRYILMERFCLALVWATMRLRHYMTQYSTHLISRLDHLRYFFDRLTLPSRLMRWLVLMIEFDTQYVTQKSIKGSVFVGHLASLLVSDSGVIDDDFLDEGIVIVTRLPGWGMYFNGATNPFGQGIRVFFISPYGDHIPRSVVLTFPNQYPTMNNIVKYKACILGLETALELGIRQIEIYRDSNLVLRQIQGTQKTRDVKLRHYHAYLKLLVRRFKDLRYTHMPRAQNQFVDALATLTSMIDILIYVVICPLVIESRIVPAYCYLIDDVEIHDDFTWYYDIYQFLIFDTYPKVATTKNKRALRQQTTRFVICDETLYRRLANGMLLLCLDRTSIDKVMREVHVRVCGRHMGGHIRS